MPQLHVIDDIIRHRENIPQNINLEFIKRPIDRGLKQRFQLMQPVFYFQSRLRVLDVSVRVSVWYRRRVVMAESEACGRCVEQARFEAGDGLVDEVVD